MTLTPLAHFIRYLAHESKTLFPASIPSSYRTTPALRKPDAVVSIWGSVKKVLN